MDGLQGEAQRSCNQKSLTSAAVNLQAYKRYFQSGNDRKYPPRWQDDVENTLWLELLHPFAAVKDLYLSEEFVLRIAPLSSAVNRGDADVAGDRKFDHSERSDREERQATTSRPCSAPIPAAAGHRSIKDDGWPQIRYRPREGHGYHHINPFLNCGLNAQLATIVVPANLNPGSVMEFYWRNLLGETGHKHRSAYDSNGCIDTLTCDEFNAPNHQVVQNQNQPDRQQVGRNDLVPAGRMYLQGTTWLARDLCPLPCRDPGSAEFYPSYTKSSSAVPKQGRSTKPSTSWATTTRETTIQAYTSPELPSLCQVPSPFMSSFTANQEFKAAVHEWIWFW
ncbi:hypothetical protein F5888DRAFT_1887337 [Russula emetica]|nr:hypothetical protein F5888DRAFT_1887337 [Russula emetica]